MSNVAISVEGLGKRYRIGAGPSEPYGNIRESLVRAAGAPLRRLRGGASGGGAMRDAWALKDVSFEVKHGEAVGIIGRNGAGKSTLLKVLSRITEPTTGQAVVHGRVGSLLEVGTGFHPELTGRENIYLNGAVMGMSRADIKRRFDEIVDFSGVETYLDTPVKRYSSGMYMRLAFAVAAHLEPEVLVVDEVLAVGDAEFQKKCLAKMSDVGRAGRTVLFVSHNMSAIKQLCVGGVLLDKGQVRVLGDAASVVEAYLSNRTADAATTIDLSGYQSPYTNGELEVLSLELVNAIGSSFTVAWDEPIKLTLRLRAKDALRGVSFGVGCSTTDGFPLFTVRSTDQDEQGYHLSNGEYLELSTSIAHNLRAGFYNLMLGISSGNCNYYYNPQAAEMEVLDVGTRPYLYKNNGVMNCNAEWSL